MNRFQVFLTTLLLFYCTTYFSGGNAGITSHCYNGDCFVMASTSLFSIVCGVILGLYAILFPRQKSISDKPLEVGIWRRFGAFLVDFIVVLTVATPLLTLPLILAEYYETGIFAWSFQRDFSRTTDNVIIIPSALSFFFFLSFYFYKFHMTGQPTLGQYILGFRVTGNDNDVKKGEAASRVVLSFVGLCIWPISVLHALYNGKEFWWDEFSNTKVERIKMGTE